MFINYSNHPSRLWVEEQIKAASEYGEVVDIAFPNVAPSYTRDEVMALAKVELEKILALKPSVVMCQGEFTLCFYLVELLKQNGIKVVFACSERETVESSNDDGSTKISHFRFVQFREY